jgi:CBS domain-containing protein
MQARDVMVAPVITVKPNSSVRDVANLFLKHKISAVPVVDDTGKLVGIVTEGDLLHRVENDTEMRRSSWLRIFTDQDVLAAEYAKSHSRKVADVMTTRVVFAAPEASLADIAMLMERHSIKRVPIVNKGPLVGIVSRANLIQALATAPPSLQIPLSDQAIRDRLLAHLRAQPWPHTAQLNATVKDGVVDVWGICHSNAEREAVRIAAENIPGVRAVKNNMSMPPIGPFI